MELFSLLTENERIKRTLAKDIFENKNSHAYIIEGNEGSGRHLTVKLAVAALLCENRDSDVYPCLKCNNCKKTLDDINTDVIYIDSDKSAIGVDSIREIKNTLYFAPTEMKYKAYVIENADRLTTAAQNALLLSLEEPPEFVVFFLICENSSLLLETVRSRAPVIRTEVFSNDFIRDTLLCDSECRKIFDGNPDLFNTAVIAGNGALGKTREILMNPKDSSTAEAVKKAALITEVLCRNNSYDRVTALKELDNDREEFSVIIKYICLALRDILTEKFGGNGGLRFYFEHETPKRLSSKISTDRLNKIYNYLINIKTDNDSNVSLNALQALLLTF